MAYKLITNILRNLFSFYVYYNLIHNKDLSNSLCGPLTLSPQPSVLFYICIIQFVRCQAPLLKMLIAFLHQLNLCKFIKKNESSSLFLKYCIVLLLKTTIIFSQSHRLQYYLHVLLLETGIVIGTFLVDCLNNSEISQVSEIILGDPLNILTTLYQLTRTFCPNYGIYWFICNLLILCISQIEGHAFQYNKHNIKRSTLFVKHDIYRLFVFTIGYFGIFSLVQIPTYGTKMLLFFCISIYFFYLAISNFDQGRSKHALIWTIVGILSIFITELICQNLLKTYIGPTTIIQEKSFCPLLSIQQNLGLIN